MTPFGSTEFRGNEGGGRGNPALEAAQFYARRGWPVLPLWWPEKGGCACGASDCGSPGKHPLGILVPHGVKEATTDPETIRQWWRRYPRANVGVATGPVSGLLVVDIDPRHGGHPDQLPGPVPRTPRVRTGGGCHLYLAWPEGIKRLPKTLPGCPGVDLKGQEGYVVAPPSCHVAGACYRWEVTPAEVSLAPCPDWLWKRITAARPSQGKRPIRPASGGAYGTPYGRAALRRELARLAQTPVGDRNNALNRAAFVLGKLVAAGHLDEGMVAGLLASLGCQIGLGCREVDKTTKSGLTAGLREGRP